MLYVTIALFALAALVGVIILKNWLTSAKTSRTVVYLHGIFAAAGLGLLAYLVYENGVSAMKTSLIIFLIAALVGFYMFFQDLKGKYSPTWLAIMHGLVAVAAFVILLLTVL